MKLPLYGMIRRNNLLELYIIKNVNIQEEKISTYNQIADVFIKKLKIHLLAQEHSYIFCMLNDGSPIGICEVSKGDHKHTVVSINIMGRYLLLTGADRFVLVHNHPNNSCEESADDIILTNKTKELANLLDVDLEDHLIICRTGWKSMFLCKEMNI